MKKEVKQSAQDNSFGVASVVLGILSIIFASFNGLILSVIALIFANKQRKINANKWSKAGKILGIIGLVISIALIVLIIVGLATNPDLLSSLPQ